jgi:hypothetical protein
MWRQKSQEKTIGWLLTIGLGLVSLGILIMEIVFTLKDPEGRRWGDHLANTKVIEVNE